MERPWSRGDERVASKRTIRQALSQDIAGASSPECAASHPSNVDDTNPHEIYEDSTRYCASSWRAIEPWGVGYDL